MINNANLFSLNITAIYFLSLNHTFSFLKRYSLVLRDNKGSSFAMRNGLQYVSKYSPASSGGVAKPRTMRRNYKH
jgi:hypothetical protein